MNGNTRERSGGTGCLKGCGCFSLGFITGLIVLPLLLYTVSSIPAFRNTLRKYVNTRQLEQRINRLAARIGSNAGTEAAKAVEPESTSLADMGEGRSPLEHVLKTARVEIRYHLTSPADARNLFVYGEVKNIGDTPVRTLSLEIIFPLKEGSHRETFTILEGHAKRALAPGATTRFAIHPQESPGGWSPSTVQLKVDEIR